MSYADFKHSATTFANGNALKITNPIACEKNTTLRTRTGRALMSVKKSVPPQHSAAVSPITISTRCSRQIFVSKVSKISLVEHR